MSGMNTKLAAFVALVVCYGSVSAKYWPISPDQTAPERADIVLLPQMIGDRQIVRQWNNDLESGDIEQGAVYATAKGTPVQLDFFRTRFHAHNGVACYLSEGESLVEDGLRTLKTSTDGAVFDVALLRSENALRIVAATECAANQCAEQPVSAPLQAAFLPQRSLVPTSIMLTRPVGKDDGAAVAAQLNRELEEVIAQINLEPARRLAASR